VVAAAAVVVATKYCSVCNGDAELCGCEEEL